MRESGTQQLLSEIRARNAPEKKKLAAPLSALTPFSSRAMRTAWAQNPEERLRQRTRPEYTRTGSAQEGPQTKGSYRSNALSMARDSIHPRLYAGQYNWLRSQGGPRALRERFFYFT